MASARGCCMEDGYCGKCFGASLLVIGALVLIKEYLFPVVPWGAFVGALLVVIGILRLIRPNCGCGGYCCAPSVEEIRKSMRKK